MRKSTLASFAVAGMFCAPFVGMGAAAAADGDTMANLQPVALNGAQASGTAMVEVNGTRIDVTMAASGLLADSPHAAHIHFGADAAHECPAADADANGSGTIDTSEGAPAYGPVVVSLTKTGDTSPDSTLAIDRYDTAPGGELSYERGSIEVAPEIATAIAEGQAVVVVHGVDHNHNGTYDGKAKSDLDPSLPAEATDPAICGVLAAAPDGGVDAGVGGAAADQNTGMIAIGGGLLAAAVGFGAVAARRNRTTV